MSEPLCRLAGVRNRFTLDLGCVSGDDPNRSIANGVAGASVG